MRSGWAVTQRGGFHLVTATTLTPKNGSHAVIPLRAILMRSNSIPRERSREHKAGDPISGGRAVRSRGGRAYSLCRGAW